MGSGGRGGPGHPRPLALQPLCVLKVHPPGADHGLRSGLWAGDGETTETGRGSWCRTRVRGRGSPGQRGRRLLLETGAQPAWKLPRVGALVLRLLRAATRAVGPPRRDGRRGVRASAGEAGGSRTLVSQHSGTLWGPHGSWLLVITQKLKRKLKILIY